jgi:hypothetical protein
LRLLLLLLLGLRQSHEPVPANVASSWTTKAIGPGCKPLFVPEGRVAALPRFGVWAAAGEDGQTTEERPLRLGQQVMTPGNCVAHRLLAIRRVSGATAQ